VAYVGRSILHIIQLFVKNRMVDSIPQHSMDIESYIYMELPNHRL
jgi:hypothetical protein